MGNYKYPSLLNREEVHVGDPIRVTVTIYKDKKEINEVHELLITNRVLNSLVKMGLILKEKKILGKMARARLYGKQKNKKRNNNRV